MRRAFVLFVLSAQLLAAPALAQKEAAPAPVLTAQGLREDARVLRRALEGLHPGLHRYHTRAQRERHFAELERRLPRARTLPEAYLTLATFLSQLRCAHTFPNPVNQTDAVAEAVFRQTPRVPFYFRWLDGRMVVTRDVSAEQSFPVGTEVLAINGVSTRALLERLLPVSRTDGGNEAKRVANLEVRPDVRWQAFDVYFPLVQAPPAGAWSFRVRLPGGKSVTRQAAPATAAQRLGLYEALRRGQKEATEPPWTLSFPEATTAVLRMTTWVTFNDSWDWKAFLQRTFESLEAKGVTGLVVDLRGNEGGSAVGDVLLAHLSGRELPRDAFARFTRYRALPDPSLRPYLETWDRSFDDWGERAVPAEERQGFFRLTRSKDEAALEVIRPVAPRFGGRVAVLVGPENSSATFLFALALRRHGLGTLVGRPTGGNQRGINGGAFYFLRLPHSGIEVDLPLIGYYPPEARPDAGLTPDVAVQPTAADLGAGRDVELEAARQWLRGPHDP